LQPFSLHKGAPEAAPRFAVEQEQPAPSGNLQTPQKAAIPALDPGMTVSHAFSAIVQSALDHLHANEHGVLVSADPEFVHQMRVAVRRLRSALSVFASTLPPGAREPIAADLKWLGNALGPARDWDVFAQETLPRVRAAYPDHAHLAGLAAQTAHRRGLARAAARRALRSARYQAFMTALTSWIATRAWRETADAACLAVLDSPIRAYAQTELEKRYGRTRRRGRNLETLSAPELHRFRIAIKKLRYAMDFFSSLFDREAVRPLRSRLSRLQDILGTINDAATLQQVVEQGFSRTRAPAAAEARGMLLGWAAGRAEALGHELNRAWKPFRRTQTYW
jgi:triphosphatase